MSAPLLEITWTDPVTGRKGYVVLDTLVRGLASGGLRIGRRIAGDGPVCQSESDCFAARVGTYGRLVFEVGWAF